MIRFNQVSLMRGVKPLLENVDLTLNPGDKIGLIGPNGAGKSSLFGMLRNELHPDQGNIDFPAKWRMAYVAQETPPGDSPPPSSEPRPAAAPIASTRSAPAAPAEAARPARELISGPVTLLRTPRICSSRRQVWRARNQVAIGRGGTGFSPCYPGRNRQLTSRENAWRALAPRPRSGGPSISASGGPAPEPLCLHHCGPWA